MFFMDWTTMAGDSGFTDSDCIGWWQFDQGIGTATDSSASGVAATLVNAAWAGAGTFTYDESTLKMTGANKYIYHKDALELYKFQIETGGDSNAIILKDINGGNSTTLIYHTIEQKSGKLVSDSNENIQIGRTFGNVLVAAGKGAIAFAEVERWYIFQNGQTGTMNFPSASSADKDLTINDLFITSSSSIEVLPQGNLTFSTRVRVDDNNTLNANGKTITSKLVDLNGTATLTLGDATLTLTDDSNGLTSESGVTLNAGPGCIIDGDDSGQKVIFQSQGHWEVVGNISDLNVTNEELAVFGQVTNCTGDIHQWLPHFEKDVMLDADTSSDTLIDRADDIDRNNELIN
jgi:hypothetical protein